MARSLPPAPPPAHAAGEESNGKEEAGIMSENHLPNDGHPSSAMRRGNIKSVPHLQTKVQWKEIIRKGCLERAKIARRQRLRRSRLHDSNHDEGIGLVGYCRYDAPGASNIHSDTNVKIGSSKRGRDESNVDWNIGDYDDEVIVDHSEGGDSCIASHAVLSGENNDRFDHHLQRLVSGTSEENAVDTARALVELELQRALTGMQHHHQVCPFDGGVPWKKTHGGEISLREMNECQAIEEAEFMDDKYKEEYTMSRKEFMELLNDVTEELQRDAHIRGFSLLDELIEEEICELERAEAMELENIMHQIDDFVSWEELQHTQQQHSQPNTYISPFANLNSPLLTCPICNSSSLTETPHEGIQCIRATANGPKNCSFQLDIAHEGLTLNHLQIQLTTVYEDHSRICSRGVLKFRVEKRVGVSMLMAKCDVCSSDVVVM